ncbi:MAG: endolytic transglycosylase MltG [Clostridia bacterium]|nr:endolytic transglycosylase MltG [Clostridia bacterium]
MTEKKRGFVEFCKRLMNGRAPRRIKRVWFFLRPVSLGACALLLTFLIFYMGIGMAYQRFIAPPKPDDQTMETFRIEPGSSLGAIAKDLQAKGYVRSSTVFKYYVDFTDRTRYIKAGDYQLAPCMTLEQLVETLSFAAPSAPVLKIRIREGDTIEAMAAIFVENGILEDTAEFLSLCKEGRGGEAEKAYDIADDFFFLRTAKDTNKPRKYLLEGYLFPETYNFFSDATPRDLVEKLLRQYQKVYYSADYASQADEMDMTDDEVLTLASIIQREAGRQDDFFRVSAVLHNRINAGMRLQMDSTVSYAKGIHRLNLTSEDTEYDSPYNTYRLAGLPPGPICSPSEAAIKAVLMPDADYLAQKYLYFCTGDPALNELVFAKTLDEHNSNVSKYRPLWIAWDEMSAR